MKKAILLSIITITVLFSGCDLTNESGLDPVEELIVATINTNWASLTPLITSESTPRTIADSTGNHARPGEGFLSIYIKVKPENASWEVTWESDKDYVFYDRTKGQIVCKAPDDGSGNAKLTFTTVGKDKDGNHISYDVFIRSTVTGN